MGEPSITDRLLARHWLTHPEESAYAAAKHLGLSPRTVQVAAQRLRKRVGTSRGQLLQFLVAHPIPQKSVALRHPNPETWLRKPPVPVSLGGEDAAAVLGWDLVPNRHTYYVSPEDFEITVKSLLDNGARLTDADGANVTIRVRDEWLLDEPAPLVERGQRLLDYATSKNIQLLMQLREDRPA